MSKLVRFNNKKVIKPFVRDIKIEKVYPLSLLQGYQSGDIWVDSKEDPEFCMFWHRCGFAYLSGEVDVEILEEIKDKMYHPLFGHSDRLVLLTEKDKIVDKIMLSDNRIIKKERARFRFNGHKYRAIDTNQMKIGDGFDSLDRFTLQVIDDSNYDGLVGKVVPNFSWESKEQFLKNGFGFCLLRDGRMISCAFSAAISNEYVDIGVETIEGFRHKGYGKVVAFAMIREILNRKQIPVWQCNYENEHSIMLANWLGFELTEKYYMYCLKD